MEKQIETIVVECPSPKCNNQKRLYRYIGDEGVPWRRKAVYKCELCDARLNVPYSKR